MMSIWTSLAGKVKFLLFSASAFTSNTVEKVTQSTAQITYW